MAVDIGPRIGIQGEAEYRQQLNQIITQTKTLHAEMRSMESAWNKDTSAKQKAAQQSKMLNSAITAQEQKLSELQKGLDEASKKYGENDSRTLKWRQAVANATTELNKLKAQLRDVPNGIQLVGQSMQETGSKMEAAGKKISSVGSTMTKTITLPLTAMATAAVKTTAGFDSSMSKVAAVSGATGTEFEALRSKAREMGATTKYSASEAADAMNYMAMAGWKTEEMMNGVEGIMNLAAASGEDLATTSDIVTDALTAFGKSAKDSGRLADIMAAASSNANTNVGMMGETFKYAAPVAGSLGFTMEDTAVAIGLMANAGIKSSQAGTALRKGMTNLVKPTKAMETAMKKYGIEVTNSDGTMKSLREIMDTLRGTLGNLSEAEQANAAATIFGQNAMAGWLAVINGSDADWNKLTTAIDNSNGTAKSMAETMQDNLAGQLTILKSQLQELAISFGDILVPKIRTAVEWVQKQVDKFNAMDDATKEQIVKFGLLAAAIGPVLTVAGKLVSTGGTMVKTAGKVVSAIGGMVAKHAANTTAMVAEAGAAKGAAIATKGFGTSLKALALNPVTLAITGAVAAIIALKKGYDYIKKSAKEANTELYNSISAVDETGEAMDAATLKIRDGFKNSASAISDVEASARSATGIADQIAELTSKQSLNREEQTKLKVLVGEMNAIYPQMGLAIDETGNALNRSTEEIQAFITESYEMAKAAAYADAVKASLEAMAEAELAVAKAEIEQENLQKQLTAAEADREAHINKVTASMENMDDVTRELTASGTALAGGTGLQTVAMRDAEQAIADNKAKQEECNAALEEARQEYELNRAAAAELAESLGITEEEILGTSTAADEMGDALSASSEEAAAAADTMEESVDNALQQMQDAYMKTAESAMDSVMNQKGLFQELQAQEATSIEEMRKGLESHIEAYRNWNENAQTLMGSSRYQTDENFRAMVNSVVSAGQDMAPELQAIVDAFESGDAELEGLVQDYGTMSQLSVEYGHSIAQAETVVKYGLEGLEQVMAGAEDDLSAAAKGVVKGVSKQFSKKDMTKAAREEARNAVDAMKVNLSSTEPQKAVTKTLDNVKKTNVPKAQSVAKSVGDAYADGTRKAVPGLNSSGNAIEKAVKDMAKNVGAQKGAAQTAGNTVTKAVGTGMEAGKSSVTTAATNVNTTVRTGIQNISNQKTSANTAGKAISDNVKKGLGSADIAGEMVTMKTRVTTGLSNIKGQKETAQNAGAAVGNGVKSGLAGKGTEILNAGKALGNKAVTGIRDNTNKDGAKNAGITLGGYATSGVNSKKEDIKAAGATLGRWTGYGVKDQANKDSVKAAGGTLGGYAASGVKEKKEAIRDSGVTLGRWSSYGIKDNANKTASKDAGVTLGGYAVSGLGSQNSAGQTAGSTLGGKFNSGVTEKKSAAKTAGTNVADEARKGLQSKSGSAKSWGEHMGENFASGLRAKAASVSAAATAIARAAAVPMTHTTPKEGPLKHDDVWGLHMGDNFAKGMLKSIPMIRMAAAEMAQAAVIDVVNTPMLGAGVMSGHDAAAADVLTQDMIYEAMAAAFKEMSFSIGEREFGRVLREYGAIA